MFETLGKELKQITQIKPNGPDRIEAFDAAGGTRAVQYQIREKLETEAMTVSGKPLSEILKEPIKIDEAVIRPMNKPFRPEPGLVILRGNLAPHGAIMKISAVPGAMRKFSGPARIFDDEDVAIRELGAGKIRAGMSSFCV